ncbi:MAG: hypothetical protein ABIJ08_00455 [Nanoarchaeota archaeon]
MKNFKKAIFEIYKTFDLLLIFDSVLTAAIVFLSCFLIFMLIGVNVLYSAIVAVIYLGYSISVNLSKKVKDKKLILVEEVYPDLNEKLRTAADNDSLENPVVEELQQEVIHDLKKVGISSFFSMKKATYKIFIAFIICFLIVLAALLNFRLPDFTTTIQKAPKLLFGGASDETSDSDIPSAGVSGSEDIFGEESIAKLGQEQLSIELKSLSFELTNVRKEIDIPDETFEEKFPGEVDLEQECDADCVLKNNIPIEQQDLVKDYFIKLAET